MARSRVGGLRPEIACVSAMSLSWTSDEDLFAPARRELFNRANFDLPSRIFGNPNFGRIFSAKNPREMQFGLRLTF